MPLPALRVPMLPKHTTRPAFAQLITAKSIFCLSTARRLGLLHPQILSLEAVPLKGAGQ